MTSPPLLDQPTTQEFRLIDFPLPTRPKILVVDDQPLNIQVIYLAFAGEYDVFMATSGAQALLVCAKQQPDLIILDIEMPEMDGFEVCAQLKAEPATREIPIIFVTAHSDPLIETRGLEAGAADFISKPINPQIVRARVKTQITLKIQADLLRNWAYMDGLTNVHNRRYFDEQLVKEWGRASRSGSDLSLLFLDVDCFKLYNDHYGHQAGDACLHTVAATFKSSMKRYGDMVARYGGEEFVCLLPDTGLAGAMHFAEQLRQQIMDLNIEHIASTAKPVITVSLGAACKPAGNTISTVSATDLLKLADNQLYIAKENGRNRVFGKEISPA